MRKSPTLGTLDKIIIFLVSDAVRRGGRAGAAAPEALGHPEGGHLPPLLRALRRGLRLLRPLYPRDGEGAGCERSVKIELNINKTYFENKSNTILKFKDLAAKIK